MGIAGVSQQRRYKRSRSIRERKGWGRDGGDHEKAENRRDAVLESISQAKGVLKD